MEGNRPAGKFEVLMLFIAEMEGKKHHIEVKESISEWLVELVELQSGKKESHRLSKKDYRQTGELISFIFKHRSYLIDIVRKGDDYTVFTKGSHKSIQLLTEERMLYNKLAGGEAGESLLKAGMPGKIVEIKAKAGDKVQEGDLLLVMEAMKMENEMRAEAPGRIKKIYVRKGQNVETGAKLILLKKNQPAL